jgi:hypothetical protein
LGHHAAAPLSRFSTLAPALPEEAQEGLPKRRAVEIRHYVAVEAKADASALLAYDHNDCVGFFGDPEPRSMAGPERLVENLGVRHRKENSGLRDPQVSDNDRSIVQLVQAFGDEQAHEQLSLNRGVDPRSLSNDELVEVRVLLERNDRSDAMPRQVCGRCHHFVNGFRFLLPRKTAEEGARANTHQAATNVVLEDDDDDEGNRIEKPVQQTEKRAQASQLRYEIHDGDHTEANPHLHRSSAS